MHPARGPPPAPLPPAPPDPERTTGPVSPGMARKTLHCGVASVPQLRHARPLAADAAAGSFLTT